MFDGMYKFATSILTFGGIAVGGILTLLYFFQNKMLYIPSAPNRFPDENSQGYRNPKESKLDYEDIEITTRDGIKIRGWLLPYQNRKFAPTIIYFHENAGNIGTRIPFMAYMQKHLNSNIVLVAYRGFSNSEGSPTEEGLKADGEAVVKYVFSRDDLDLNNVYIFGRSLGGAVGIHAASNTEYKLKGLILENTFTSIPAMVDIIFPKLAFFKGLILKNYWYSINSISKIKIPIFFIMGMKDELIPSIQMLELYNAAKSASLKDRYEVPNGGHNDTWFKDIEAYFEALGNFMKKC